MEIKGSVALVTGGASGIGRGIAEELKAAGAEVVIADMDANQLAATASEIGVLGVPVDVADIDSMRALERTLIDRHGGLDLLVNNAGVGPMAKISDLTLEDWKWMLDVNLWGVIHGIDVFLPHLLKRGHPTHVVNTASMSIIDPQTPLGAYAVTKAGVAALTEVLAQEMEQDKTGVGVTLLAPANVHSEIGRSQRNRPGGARGLKDVDLLAEPDKFPAAQRWLHPQDVGRMVVDAIEQDTLFLFTHPELWPRAEQRQAKIRAAFMGDR